MSQENRPTDVKAETQQLLKGSLKHVRAAALAAALAPLAAVAASPAVQQQNGSGGVISVVPSPCDFVTSGGFVFTDSGQKASFGAHGGCKRGAFWGHVNFVDHSTGYHLNSTEVTGYVTPAPGGTTVREICGMARTNGDEPQPVFFRIRLVDNGEPGTNDAFGIATSNGYSISTRQLGNDGPGGGNVQLHDPNPSTAGPEVPPSEFAMCAGVVVQ